MCGSVVHFSILIFSSKCETFPNTYTSKGELPTFDVGKIQGCFQQMWVYRHQTKVSRLINISGYFLLPNSPTTHVTSFFKKTQSYMENPVILWNNNDWSHGILRNHNVGALIRTSTTYSTSL